MISKGGRGNSKGRCKAQPSQHSYLAVRVLQTRVLLSGACTHWQRHTQRTHALASSPHLVRYTTADHPTRRQPMHTSQRRWKRTAFWTCPWACLRLQLCPTRRMPRCPCLAWRCVGAAPHDLHPADTIAPRLDSPPQEWCPPWNRED